MGKEPTNFKLGHYTEASDVVKRRLTRAGISLVAAMSLLPLGAGCGYFKAVRSCAAVGAVIGGIVGASAGAALGQQTTAHAGAGRVGAGFAIGLAGGALLGGVAGHYMCDPAAPPPR